MELPKVYLELEKIFSQNGYALFMVGGTSRDYLLGREILDFDFVSDATPSQMKEFLSFDESFVSIGSVHISFLGHKVDITTLRVEEDYKDYRHPNKVAFVKELRLDAKRRDISINALYIDKNGNVYAYWLASPSANNDNYVMNVNYNGNVNNNNYNNENYGARPVDSKKLWLFY